MPKQPPAWARWTVCFVEWGNWNCGWNIVNMCTKLVSCLLLLENPADGLTKSSKLLSLWANLVDAVGLVPGPHEQGSNWSGGWFELLSFGRFTTWCALIFSFFSLFPLSYELKKRGCGKCHSKVPIFKKSALALHAFSLRLSLHISSHGSSRRPESTIKILFFTLYRYIYYIFLREQLVLRSHFRSLLCFTLFLETWFDLTNMFFKSVFNHYSEIGKGVHMLMEQVCHCAIVVRCWWS